MADEDFGATKMNTREQVRPSMVVMTGKLLGVTESIAAMNLRIAAGVVFCIILLIATFVVNVIAFDYAKDEKRDDSMFMVDKSSGDLLNYHPLYYRYEPTMDYDSLKLLKEVIVYPTKDSEGIYQVNGVLKQPCSVEGRTARCKDGYEYEISTANGKTLYAIEASKDGHTAVIFKSAEEVVKFDETYGTGSTRHLLFCSMVPPCTGPCGGPGCGSG